MKGAVIYGIKPSKIVSRKSPFTIGIGTYSERKEGTECRNMKEDRCEYFDVFISKGDDVKNNEEVSKRYIPLSEDQKIIEFSLYFSKMRNQIYIDENAIKISNFTMPVNEMNIPIEERKFEVKMKFGSFITVTGKNLVTGEKVKILANYYNRNDK